MGVAPKIIEGGKKVHLFMGKAKTMSNVPVGFPEYGMTNASNFRWGLLPASNSQREREREAFICGINAPFGSVKWKIFHLDFICCSMDMCLSK